MHRFTKCTLFILLPAVIAFSATAKKAEKDPPLVLKHADQMENHGSGEKMWSHLVGNVEFQHGEVNLRSQEADYYRAEQRVDLRNQVTLTMPDKEMTTDRMIYRKADQRVEARGNVVIRDLKAKTTLVGAWGEYFRDKKFAKMFGKPVLTNIDTTGKDTLRIVSDSMLFDENESKATTLGNVRITMGNTLATGGKGEYFDKANQAFLKEKPVFYQDNNTMAGKIIQLFIKQQKIDEIYVYQDASGRYVEKDSTSDSSRISEVYGDTIHMLLENDAIHQLFVLQNAKSYSFTPGQRADADEARGKYIRMDMDKDNVKEVLINGNAQSLYHNREKEKVTGRNNAQGDTIHVFFNENKVSFVTVLGGARGKYLIIE